MSSRVEGVLILSRAETERLTDFPGDVDARSDARSALFCGGSVQGRIQLAAIKYACPTERALVFEASSIQPFR
jgi:hypothetical protein